LNFSDAASIFIWFLVSGDKFQHFLLQSLLTISSKWFLTNIHLLPVDWLIMESLIYQKKVLILKNITLKKT